MSKLTLALAASLAASTLLAATPEPQRDFGFQPLEIYNFKERTSRLNVVDLNGDGLDDIVFANNRVSRLEILLRKPENEDTAEGDLPELDERFEDRGIIVDQNIRSIRIADLNGDKRPDIATFGKDLGLLIRHQNEDGSFAEPKRVFLKERGSVASFQLVDLDNDDRKDVLVCRRKQADILWNTPDGFFQERTILAFSHDKGFYGDTADFNQDGIADLYFHFNTERDPVRIRYGKGDGLYGIEQPIDLPPRQYADIFKLKDGSLKLGMVLKNRQAFRTYAFTEKEQPQLLDAQEFSPGRIGLEGTSKKEAPAWITTDFNHDRFDDLLVAAPELSRLHLYTGQPDGLNPEPKRIDTLSELNHLSRLANGDLLVISRKEKVAALHRAADLEAFPSILKTPGDVLTGCTIASANECWLVCKNDEKELQLVRYTGEHQALSIHPLELENDPKELLAFQLPEGQVGLIFFMAYDTPRMKLFNGESFEDLTSESFRALAQMLKRTHIQFDQPGDGTSLVVTQKAIARRFKWVDGRYKVMRQFNPENPRGELIATTPYNLLDGSTGTLLYDRNSSELIHFSTDGKTEGKLHIPDADPTIFNLVQLKNPKRDSVVLIDHSGLNLILGNGIRLDITPEAEYASPSENPLLAYANDVELGNPTRSMIALVDPANHAIELVGIQDKQLRKELLFEVFLTSDFVDHSQTRATEPHDIESGDLNGDGIGDLVVLSQDKLIIYLGE